MQDPDRGKVHRSSRAKYPTAEAQAACAQIHLRELAQLQAQTDPAGGDQTAKNKDHRAFEALLEAGRLVETVAGWALDHIAGLSMQEQRVLPRQPPRSRNLHEYRQSRLIADRHDHETNGSHARYADCFHNLTSGQRRTLLRNLIYANAGGWPDWLKHEAVNALDGLGTGEAAPILSTAVSTRLKVRHRAAQAQLKLVAIARYQAKVYGRVGESKAFVAKKAGVDLETLRTWEKQLPQRLTALTVESAIEYAENAASHVKHFNAKQRDGGSLSKDESEMREWHERNYNLTALEIAVAELQSAQRDDA